MTNTGGDSASTHSQSFPCSGNSSNDNVGDFECNICLELAQDPIITLCGHLYCWPCLYKWLRLHAYSPECPVCKAVVQEEKLIPLYGRGKASTDPRSTPVPGVEIPHRPTGTRPETAPPLDPNHLPHHGFGFMGGFPPMGVAMGNFGLIAGFGGLFPSLFNFHFQGFPPDPAAYGAPAGFPYGFGSLYHRAQANGYPPRAAVGQQESSFLTILFLLVGAFVIFALFIT